MRASSGKGKNSCWVDLFQASEFSGRMRRIFGPGKIDQPDAASMIVGPEARVEVTIARRGKESIVNFEPNRLATNLKSELRGAKIVSVTIRRPPESRPKRSRKQLT